MLFFTHAGDNACRFRTFLPGTMIFRSTKTSARNRFITVFIGASLFAALWIWSEMITWDRLCKA